MSIARFSVDAGLAKYIRDSLMKEDLYTPPKADLHIEEAPSGSLMKGVTYGAAIDIVGTTVFVVLLGIAYGILLASQGYSQQEIMAQSQQVDMMSPIGILSIIVGLIASFLAGYFCAMKSGVHVKKATIIVCVISSVLGFVLGYGQYSMLENVVMSAFTVSAIMTGSGLWWARHARS